MWKRMTLIAVAAMAILAVAMPGSAEETAELHPADRALVHGYDPDAMQLLWATVLRPENACELDEEALSESGEYVYEVDEDENVTVTGAAGDCTFHATDVTGPQGQVNHGTVVSNFVRALKESGYEGGIGCFVRLIAQSEYGKGDQQVTTEEAAAEDADQIAGAETTVGLTVSETTCGKPDHAGPPEGKGKPDHAGPPDGKGKPDHAGKPGGNGKP